MRQFGLFISVTSLFNGAYAASVAERAPASRCVDAVVTETFKIGEVDITHYNCPCAFASRGNPETARSEANIVQARQQGSCDTDPTGGPDPNCVDNENCESTFIPFPLYGVKTDCDHITATLENTPGAFSVAPGSSMWATYQTCAFRWDNLSRTNTTLDYSYWNFGSVGSSLYLINYDIFGVPSGDCIAPDFDILVLENLN